MGCVLRVYGEHLDIDALLSSVSLIAVAIWKTGQERILKGRFHSNSGANFVASHADVEDFLRVIVEVELFLKQNHDELYMLTSAPGATGAVLDFAVATRPGLVIQTGNFSSAFLQRMADLNLALAVSHYPTDDISD
jgi:hypothetical protein